MWAWVMAWPPQAGGLFQDGLKGSPEVLIPSNLMLTQTQARGFVKNRIELRKEAGGQLGPSPADPQAAGHNDGLKLRQGLLKLVIHH